MSDSYRMAAAASEMQSAASSMSRAAGELDQAIRNMGAYTDQFQRTVDLLNITMDTFASGMASIMHRLEKLNYESKHEHSGGDFKSDLERKLLHRADKREDGEDPEV